VAYGFVSGAVYAAHATALPLAANSIVFAIGVSGICIDAFVVYKIFRGRNWARITYLVLFLLGIVFAVHGFTLLLERSPTRAALSLVVQAARFIALVLLFTRPSGAWFRPKAS
jgi:hypothetical protein